MYTLKAFLAPPPPTQTNHVIITVTCYLKTASRGCKSVVSAMVAMCCISFFLFLFPQTTQLLWKHHRVLTLVCLQVVINPWTISYAIQELAYDFKNIIRNINITSFFTSLVIFLITSIIYNFTTLIRCMIYRDRAI